VTAVKKTYPSAVAVEKAADILACLAEQKSASVMELASAVRLSGSAVHRILTALKRKGLVEQDTESDRYVLSWGLLALARSLVNQDQLANVALHYMTPLGAFTGETVTLYARSGFERICVEQVESAHEISYRAEIGRSLPLYAGASGLTLLAFVPPAQLDEYLRTISLEPLTEQTISDERSLRLKLEAIRAAGHCFAKNDRVLGLAGLSAPIPNEDGTASAVVTIAGPAERIEQADLAAWTTALAEACTEIAAILHGQPQPGARAHIFTAAH
jgi:DNA-binding IclR family transcriptional regulator